jgi:hypothetical protein
VHRPAPSRKLLVGEEDTLRVILYARGGKLCPLYPVEGETDYLRVEYAALLGGNIRQPRLARSNSTATRFISLHSTDAEAAGGAEGQ